MTEELVAAGKLCYPDVSDFETEIWKQLIYHKNKWISGSMRAFIDYLKEKEFSR